ncbi:hypothetical protein PtrSN002B_012166 [Pyrenophora tritici-repentis]|nr:hypothetical protein Alg130_10584 [Pyrenophora tritici-repentis]KAI1522623.1 hypothetical protein PtrSN002B_012166 [Pyrenophora tritici-repentis]
MVLVEPQEGVVDGNSEFFADFDEQEKLDESLLEALSAVCTEPAELMLRSLRYEGLELIGMVHPSVHRIPSVKVVREETALIWESPDGLPVCRDPLTGEWISEWNVRMLNQGMLYPVFVRVVCLGKVVHVERMDG